MPNVRDQIQLTDDEQSEFLATAKTVIDRPAWVNATWRA